jgi:hypothetical protein
LDGEKTPKRQRRQNAIPFQYGVLADEATEWSSRLWQFGVFSISRLFIPIQLKTLFITESFEQLCPGIVKPMGCTYACYDAAIR